MASKEAKGEKKKPLVSLSTGTRRAVSKTEVDKTDHSLTIVECRGWGKQD